MEDGILLLLAVIFMEGLVFFIDLFCLFVGNLSNSGKIKIIILTAVWYILSGFIIYFNINFYNSLSNHSMEILRIAIIFNILYLIVRNSFMAFPSDTKTKE